MADSDDQDAEDLHRSQSGDGLAFARIVRRHQPGLQRWMRSFGRSEQDVQELVQEVFIEAYANLTTYRGDGPFAGWIRRIGTRVGYRYWKKASKRREVERDVGFWRGQAQQCLEGMDPSSAHRLIQYLLGQLPPRDRLVILLLYMEGRSIDETAAETGWSKTMVKVQAYRARQKLKTLCARLGVNDIQSAFELDNVPDGGPSDE